MYVVEEYTLFEILYLCFSYKHCQVYMFNKIVVTSDASSDLQR